jgi:AcrR family transcriptional regulator
MTVPPTAPQPRVRREEVRRRLLEAAAQVFAQRGYAGARLDEIANVAGFTKGAVYSNFSGKHALLVELIDQHLRREFEVREQDVKSKRRPERAVEDIADAYAHAIVENSTWSRLMVELGQQAGYDEEVRDAYLEARRGLRQQLAERLAVAAGNVGLEFTVPAEQVALSLQSLRLGLSLEHGTDPEQVDLSTVRTVIAAVLRGLVR